MIFKYFSVLLTYGSMLAYLGQFRANLKLTWASLGANLGPTWAQLGDNLGQSGAKLGQLFENYWHMASCWPTWSNLVPTWGQLGANLGPTWVQLGATWLRDGLKLASDGSKLAQDGSKLVQVASMLASSWPPEAWQISNQWIFHDVSNLFKTCFPFSLCSGFGPPSSRAYL